VVATGVVATAISNRKQKDLKTKGKNP